MEKFRFGHKLHGKPPSGLKQRVTSLKISDGSGAPEDWVGRTHGRKGSSKELL